MRRLPAWLVLVAAALLVLPAAAQDPKGKGKGKGKKAPNPSQPSVKLSTGDVPLGRSTWKPAFDYTRLPPPNETLWAQLVKDGVDGVEMDEALAVAAEALGGTVWAKRIWLEEFQGAPAWRLQLFTTSDGSEGPRRADLVVARLEPKVLERVDLPSLPQEDGPLWNGLAQAKVQAEALISLCKEKIRGDEPDPEVTDPHVRWIEFVNAEPPFWKCEVMGMQYEFSRRYEFEVKSDRLGIRQRILLDRFPGTPLRKERPIELPNGMYLHDFVVGDGPLVARDSRVQVQYRLFLLDNTKLHDTWKTNQPETFLVTGAPLKGMTEGLIGMRVGGKRKIAMPFDLAFGEQGNEIAPPKAMVVCDVSVVEVTSP